MRSAIWILKAIVFIVLLGAIAFAHMHLRGISSEVGQLEAENEDRPQRLEEVGRLSAQIEDRRADLTRIQDYIVTREELARVVTMIEQEAQRADVEAEVTDIEEVIDPETGEPFPGPIKDVDITIVASGEAQQLLSFLYHVEHLPFLTRIASWRLGGSNPNRAGIPTAPSEGTPTETAQVPEQALSANVIIVITQE